MTYLLLQTFLLLLTAFFFGAFVACILKRLMFGSRVSEESLQTAAVVPATEPGGPFPRTLEPIQPKIETVPRPIPVSVDTSRFERALSGPGSGPPATSTQPAVTPPPPQQPSPPLGAAVAAAAAIAAARVASPAPAAEPPVAAPPPAPTPAPAAAEPPAAPKEPPQPAPAPSAPPAPAAAVVAAAASTQSGGDDFTRIRAIDAGLRDTLHGAGVRTFNDMARWSADDIRRVDSALSLGGRVEREQWVEQAQILAKGGETYYSRTRSSSVQPSKPPAEAAIATAAALAAAAAAARPQPRPADVGSPLDKVDPAASRPARLADAIKEQESKSAESKPTAPVGEAEVTITTAGSSKSDLVHLRSVKSEALRLVEDEAPINDLKRIRGVGVLLEKKLAAAGVTSYEQIANWTAEDVDRISDALDLKGRIERENWIEQARILSSGGQTEFSRRVDKGDPDATRTPRR